MWQLWAKIPWLSPETGNDGVEGESPRIFLPLWLDLIGMSSETVASGIPMLHSYVNEAENKRGNNRKAGGRDVLGRLRTSEV